MRMRNANIELLRSISMFMVLILHSLSGSGALKYLSGLNYFVYWIMEALCVVSVDVFILITGYFQVNSKFHATKFIHIIGGVWVYNFIFSLICIRLTGEEFVARDLLRILFPIYTKKYWFINAYIVLYLVSPFLNFLIHNLSKKQYSYLLAIIIIIYPIRHTFSLQTWTQTGADVNLFIVLYLIAAWLRLYYKPERIKHYSLIYFGNALFMVFTKWILMMFLPTDYSDKFIMNYISIFVVIGAVSLFLSFIYSKPIEGAIAELINSISSLSFSVYIIHFSLQSVLWTRIFRLDSVIEHAIVAVPCIIGACLLVFTFCITIEYCRNLFLCRLNKNRRYINESILKKWNEIANVNTKD